MTLEEYLQMYNHLQSTFSIPNQILATQYNPAVIAWQNFYDSIGSSTFNNLAAWQSILETTDNTSHLWQLILDITSQVDFSELYQYEHIENRLKNVLNQIQPYVEAYLDNEMEDTVLEQNITCTSDATLQEQDTNKLSLSEILSILGILISILFGYLSMAPDPQLQKIIETQQNEMAIIEELTQTIETLSNELAKLQEQNQCLIKTSNF